MRVMRKLPVVPLCRRLAVLLETPNQQHLSCVPFPQEGRIAIVTDVRRDAVDADGAERRTALEADGEVVWS